MEIIPNDIKVLAFLAQKLSNFVYYFKTFTNANKDGSNVKKIMEGNKPRPPFSYK